MVKIYRDCLYFMVPNQSMISIANEWYKMCFCRLLDRVYEYPYYPGHDRKSVERTMWEISMSRGVGYPYYPDKSLVLQRMSDLRKGLAGTDAQYSWLAEICQPYLTMDEYVTLEETVAHVKLAIDILMRSVESTFQIHLNRTWKHWSMFLA